MNRTVPKLHSKIRPGHAWGGMVQTTFPENKRPVGGAGLQAKCGQARLAIQKQVHVPRFRDIEVEHTAKAVWVKTDFPKII